MLLTNCSSMLYYLLIYLLMASCTPKLKTYQVNQITKPIELSGKGADPQWEKAALLTDFTYPWEAEMAPTTTFKALYDDSHLYFLFRADDTEIVTKMRDLGEKDAVESDRVEIFFKKDDQMNPYYSLEMDPLGRVVDTEGIYYRKIDLNWTWPKGHLLLKTNVDEQGYWVEGSISFESLRNLGMYKGDRLLHAGLFRGEYFTLPNGKTKTKWISWIKPDSEKPDFHIPSAFGVLRLKK